MSNLKCYSWEKRTRPEEFDDELILIHKAYERLCRACVKNAIYEADVHFFERTDSVADIILSLAKVDTRKCANIAKVNYEKKLEEQEKENKRHSWINSDYSHFFNGKYTAQQISELTGMCLSQVYRSCIQHPNYRFKSNKGFNGRNGGTNEV